MAPPPSSLMNLIPWRVRKYSRARHRDWVFRRGLKTFASNPEQSLKGDAPILDRLNYGWNNEDWSGCREYLQAILQLALRSSGPILECGSGLSTILLGIIARKTGNDVWALEHHEQWGARVAGVLAQLGIRPVHLCVCPLKDYGEFAWYDPPMTAMPHDFAGVVCDGPPGETKGGRYGMMPVMRSRLKPAAWVLLDDTGRESERAIAVRWASECGASYDIHGTQRGFVAMTMPSAGRYAGSHIDTSPETSR